MLSLQQFLALQPVRRLTGSLFIAASVLSRDLINFYWRYLFNLSPKQRRNKKAKKTDYFHEDIVQLAQTIYIY